MSKLRTFIVRMLRVLALLEEENHKLKSENVSLKKENETLRHECDHDHLTKLHSRKYFGEIIQKLFKNLREMSLNTVTVLFIDLDFFKKVNDSYGHEVGDIVLRAVAERIMLTSSNLEILTRGRHSEAKRRYSDLGSVARWGGEELVACFADVLAPVQIAEEIRHHVESLRFDGYPNLRVTVSIGVATATAHDSLTIEELLGRADVALYSAKTLGRNRVGVG